MGEYMIIYIDLIIILNFIIDFLILLCIDLLLKRNAKLIKIIIASLLGSISTLMLFYIKSNIILLTYKLLTSIIMILVAFQYKSFKYFKDNIFYLYMISIILGGSIYLLSNQITLSNHAIIFKDNGLKINIILILILIPLILYKYYKKTKNYQIEYSNYYPINIYYDDIVLSGTAFLDTGNNLKDPIFNRPIILVNQELITKKIKTFYIPYKVINNDGILPVFKPKKVEINKKTIKKVLIGLSDVNINGIKIILNKEII